MRKQTKLVAVLSAAALLAIGASMTSFAATGWAEENGTWVYYDKDGYQVTEAWKKSGNNWFWLNEDGEMATSTLVEDGDNTYYVDENGAMVANRWVNLENEDYYDSDDDEEPETVWYYFQSTGKAYKGGATTSFKTINGKKYAFDSDGQMLYGWVKEDSTRATGDDAYLEGVYYCGDENDGARLNNAWANLYISDYGPDDHEMQDQEYVWFWFQTNGKKFTADEKSEGGLKDKKINGQYYTFDENGIMRAEWQSAASSTASKAKYYSDVDNGSRKKGWYQAVPAEWINKGDHEDESLKWYYGDSDGLLTVGKIKTINGKKYIFNENGEMMTGLIAVQFAKDSTTELATYVEDNKVKYVYEKLGDADEVDDNYYNVASTVKGKKLDDADKKVAVYYFSSSSDDGSMKTGNQTIDVDGETYQFSFKKDGSAKGQGIGTTKDDKVLYVLGKKIKADSDYKYEVANRTTGEKVKMTVGGTKYPTDEYCIINTSGSIMKGSSYYKDADENYYHIVDGQIEYVSEK